MNVLKPVDEIVAQRLAVKAELDAVHKKMQIEAYNKAYNEVATRYLEKIFTAFDEKVAFGIKYEQDALFADAYVRIYLGEAAVDVHVLDTQFKFPDMFCDRVNHAAFDDLFDKFIDKHKSIHTKMQFPKPIINDTMCDVFVQIALRKAH